MKRADVLFHNTSNKCPSLLWLLGAFNITAWAICLSFLGLSLIVVDIASAQSEIESLTLNEAVSEALRENRELSALRISVQQAEGKLRQAGILPNPELEVSKSFDQPFHNEGEYTGSVGIKQPIPVSGRLSRAEEVARLEIEISKAEVENQERLLIGNAVGRFRELLVLEEKLRTNREIEETLQKLIDVTEKRLKVAEVSPADLNLEKLELQRVILARSSLEILRDKARIALNQLLGREPYAATAINGQPDLSLDSTTLQNADQNALSRRPDRKAMVLKLSRAAAEVSLVKAERWEDWNVGVGYERERSVFDTSSIEPQVDGFMGLSLSVPLPLWNRHQGKLMETQAGEQRARAELRALELSITSEVQTLAIELKRLKQVLEQYSNETLQLSQSNVSLLRKSYEEGLVSISAVLQAQQQLRELRQSYADAIGEFLRAHTDFETASGSINDLIDTQGGT